MTIDDPKALRICDRVASGWEADPADGVVAEAAPGRLGILWDDGLSSTVHFDPALSYPRLVASFTKR